MWPYSMYLVNIPFDQVAENNRWNIMSGEKHKGKKVWNWKSGSGRIVILGFQPSIINSLETEDNSDWKSNLSRSASSRQSDSKSKLYGGFLIMFRPSEDT